MLPGQDKFCFIMVEGVNRFIYLPSFCTMAGTATDLKILSVWGFWLLVIKQQKQA